LLNERFTYAYTGAIQGPGIARGNHKSQRGYHCWSERCEGVIVMSIEY
jgi:hypothetical protein